MPKEEFQQEVEKELTGRETETLEIIYFKLYESQMPVIEKAIETAALMLGSDRSRGYCLEMICADFLAGPTLENGDPETLLFSLARESRSWKGDLHPMAKIIPITEHFQHFLRDMKESFWGDVYGQTKRAWQGFLELESQRQRDRFSGWGRYERRSGKRRDYRNGYYERDFVTRFGTFRLRVARTREKSFLPRGIERFQRRAEEVSLLIREAFLRGLSTRAVGRVVATLTGEVVSATTVSQLTRDLDGAVRAFHEARLSDDYAYLFLDGVSLRVRRPAGRKRVQMLVAYGVRRDGTRLHNRSSPLSASKRGTRSRTGTP